MHQEDAMKIIVQFVREGPSGKHAAYGYDIYIPQVMRSYLASLRIPDNSTDGYQQMLVLSPIFYDAAWELCRRGVIRPGVHTWREQATDEGSAGSGFSITPCGRAWIQEADQDAFVPTEPERFARRLEPFRTRFGPGFHARAQEAVRCYDAHAYLACCAMCGAAAESILLATAIAKRGDAEAVLREYRTASGRTKIENMIIGQTSDQLKRGFRGLTSLLNYWRDEAAHGTASAITDNEAFTSLAMLLRHAAFVDENWDELTVNP